MSLDPWQTEMHLMLEIFEQQSEISLRKINQHFREMNRTFTDEFRDYFFKMSQQRLEISYTKVELEEWNAAQARGRENSSFSEHDRQSVSRDSTSPMVVVLPDEIPNRVIKNEVAIEIEDDAAVVQVPQASGTAASTQNDDSVQGNASGNNGNSNGNAGRSSTEPIIQLSRCDIPLGMKLPRAKRGSKKSKKTLQDKRKSPRTTFNRIS